MGSIYPWFKLISTAVIPTFLVVISVCAYCRIMKATLVCPRISASARRSAPDRTQFVAKTLHRAYWPLLGSLFCLGHCLRGLCRLCRSISVPASKMYIGISPSPGLLPIHLTLIFNLDLIWSFHWTDRMTLIKVVSGMVRLPTLVFGGASISWW